MCCAFSGYWEQVTSHVVSLVSRHFNDNGSFIVLAMSVVIKTFSPRAFCTSTGRCHTAGRSSQLQTAYIPQYAHRNMVTPSPEKVL